MVLLDLEILANWQSAFSCYLSLILKLKCIQYCSKNSDNYHTLIHSILCALVVTASAFKLTTAEELPRKARTAAMKYNRSHSFKFNA